MSAYAFSHRSLHHPQNQTHKAMNRLIFWVLTAIVNQFESAAFLPGDLVFITNLKPQRNASQIVLELLPLFNNSFSYVRTLFFNKKMNRFECVVESIDNPSKQLRIKEKYLRLIPKIKIHGIGNMDNTENKAYAMNVSAEPDQFTFYAAQYGTKLFMDRQYYCMHKESLLRPLITEYHQLYACLGVKNVAPSFAALRWVFSLMPAAMTSAVFDATKQRLNNNKRYVRIINKIAKIIDELSVTIGSAPSNWRRNRIHGYMEKLNNAFRAIDQDSRNLLMRQIWLELDALLNDFKIEMKEKHGTDSLIKLFCLDVVKNYHEVVRDQRGTLNVILYEYANSVDETAQVILDLLLADERYQKSVKLVKSIVMNIKIDDVKRESEEEEDAEETVSAKPLFKRPRLCSFIIGCCLYLCYVMMFGVTSS